MLGFRGTFPRVGKACSVLGGHFPGRENLARFQGNVFPGGKTLLGFRGTFSRVGKPCSVSGERFPGQEKLARFQGNVFPSGKSLLRSAATLLRVGKPCCVLRQHFYEHGNLAALRGQAFNDNLFAAVVSCSPTSGRMRYAPTLSGEILTQNCTIHYRVLNEQMVNAVRPCSSPRSTYAK